MSDSGVAQVIVAIALAVAIVLVAVTVSSFIENSSQLSITTSIGRLEASRA